MTLLKLTERIDNKLLLPNQELLTGIHDWFDQDSEELYRKNLKELPQVWQYRTKKFNYTLNSAGYRTKEFNDINWAKSIVIFGDSSVFGVGLPEEYTISGQIEKILNIPVINLGAPGSSSLYTLHNSVILSESYPTPKAVVSLWTSPYRLPYYTDDRVMHCGNWNFDRFKIGYYWSENKINASMQLKLNVMAFREIWKNKTNYSELSLYKSTSKILQCGFVNQIDFARDMRKQESGDYVAHPGERTNKIIAEKIISELGLHVNE